MRQKTSVLIVGGGPCGLAAACELRRLGVDVRVLEAASEPNQGSRAILLWPPALEIFRDVGILAEADRRGIRARAMNYRLPGDRVIRVKLGPENEPLLLPQAQTERLLAEALERLGGRVERSLRVSDVVETSTGVTVKAVGPDGTELVEADWLIAADGVRSTVRDRLGIAFLGERFPTTILVAEGQLDGTLDRAELHYFLGGADGILVVPLPGNRVRVGTPIGADTPLTPRTVQTLLDERGPGNMRMFDFTVISSFSSQERIADTLRQGRCFLVGDAAHTHSAIGGQGLNLGLQDVRNLVWKLAGVIDGRLRPAVLDSYDIERRQVAERTIRSTHRLARLMLARSTAARVRNGLWRLLGATGVLQRRYPPLLAGWKTHLPDALSGAAPAHLRVSHLPGPGSRTPTWIPAPRGGSATGLRLLMLGTADGELGRRTRTVADRHAHLVIHEHLPQPRDGFLLLRPDGFVAASGVRATDLDHTERLLHALAVTPG